ncbi:MAG: N-acetyltransferase family protein [Planctomycetota bacterium]
MNTTTATTATTASLIDGVTIRRARPDDMMTVAGMVRSSAEWYRAIVDEKDMVEHEVGLEWARINFRRRTFFVGELDGEPFGTISMQTFGSWCYVGYVYLDVAFVGRGLGRVLLDYVADRARQMQLDGLSLIAHPRAEWATRAYLKFGFEKVASAPDEVLAWQDGVLGPYYEQDFELYLYDFAAEDNTKVTA